MSEAMRGFMICSLLAMLVGIAGCQSAKTDYGFRCTHRALEAGLCDELNDRAPDPIKEPT